MIGDSVNIIPYLDLIAQGQLPGKKPFSAIGERTSIGTTAQGEDIWEGSATQIPVPLGVGEQMSFVSSDDADNGASATGILTARIEYLDGNGDEQTEDLTLDGTTEVDTIATDIAFVNDFYALTVGSNGVAEGNLIIYRKGDNTRIYNLIVLGGNKSLVINRKVPTGKTLYVTSWACSEANSKVVSFRLRATCDPAGNNLVEGFLFKRTYKMKNSSPYELMNPPVKICGGAIIKVSGWVGVAGGDGSASFNGYLI